MRAAQYANLESVEVLDLLLKLSHLLLLFGLLLGPFREG